MPTPLSLTRSTSAAAGHLDLDDAAVALAWRTTLDSSSRRVTRRFSSIRRGTPSTAPRIRTKGVNPSTGVYSSPSDRTSADSERVSCLLRSKMVARISRIVVFSSATAWSRAARTSSRMVIRRTPCRVIPVA